MIEAKAGEDPRPVVAVYGGSFNPPHVAHALVATALHLRGDVSEVWLLPVYRHAFEDTQRKKLAPYARRFGWCEALAAALGPWAAVSDAERRLPPPSYSIETLRYFAKEFPNKRFRLVVGADVLGETHAWRAWSSIVADFSPIVVGRQGHPAVLPAPSLAFPEVSSTALRAALRAGDDVGHWLPGVIAQDLRENGLPEAWLAEAAGPPAEP